MTRSAQRRLSRKPHPKRKGNPNHVHPFWVTRLCSVAVDLGVCATAIGFLQHAVSLSEPLILLPIYAGYFVAMELWKGRTLGKMLFGLRLCTPSGGKPGAPALLLRTLLRSAGPIGFLMMLSWKRVTLLDLVTGMRVMRVMRLGSLETPILREKEPAPCALGWR